MKLKNWFLASSPTCLGIKAVVTFFTRLRYPVSTPEEIAQDLGLNLSNSLSFQELICFLTNLKERPRKLVRFMSRSEAEENFKCALRKEKFFQDSLFSYYFHGTWMEFVLKFDEQSRLRRLYMRHRDLKNQYEIPISE